MIEHNHSDEAQEESFFSSDPKRNKKERKRIQAADRSKYKKTDSDKRQLTEQKNYEQILKEEKLLRGRVLSLTPQGIVVENEGHKFLCLLRGVLKKEKNLVKNLVTIGDFVLFEKNNESEGSIAQVEPRRSVLSRADNLSQRKEQIIAANIDQVLITVSVITPLLKPFLVDRYIIAARMGRMEPVIVVNKIDLLEEGACLGDPVVQEQQKHLYDEFLKGYKRAKIPVVSVSVENKIGLDQLKEIMRNKASVFSGQSGVGKSSLINAITGLTLQIGPTVERTRKGSHTTTKAQLIPLDFGGWCIDTPGISSFGVWDLKKDQIEQYFLEIHKIGEKCKFIDCSHSHEADCAVIKAVEKGKISSLRYDSYQSLMETVDLKHFRR